MDIVVEREGVDDRVVHIDPGATVAAVCARVYSELDVRAGEVMICVAAPPGGGRGSFSSSQEASSSAGGGAAGGSSSVHLEDTDMSDFADAASGSCVGGGSVEECRLEVLVPADRAAQAKLVALGLTKDSVRTADLRTAAQRGDWHTVQLLADSGWVNPANLFNAYVMEHDPTPHRRQTLARLAALLPYTDIDRADDCGNPALSVAAVRGAGAVVDYLLLMHANVNCRDAGGETPLSWAARCGFEGVVRSLVAHGAREAVGGDVQPAVAAAARFRHLRVVEVLLDAGFDADTPDARGATALYWASRFGYDDIVGVLLEHHADVAAMTDDGLTALHAAVQNLNEECVAMLLAHGAPRDAVDGDGKRPVDYAEAYGYTHLLDLLEAGGGSA